MPIHGFTTLAALTKLTAGIFTADFVIIGCYFTKLSEKTSVPNSLFKKSLRINRLRRSAPLTVFIRVFDDD